MFATNKGELSVCADLQGLTAEIDALKVGFANTGRSRWVTQMSPQQACIHSKVPQAKSLNNDSVNNAILLLILDLLQSRTCLQPRGAISLKRNKHYAKPTYVSVVGNPPARHFAPATGPMTKHRYTSRPPGESHLARGKDHTTCILAFREPQDDELEYFH